MSTAINKKEKIYYYRTKEWYKGPQPHFYNASDFPGTIILESNYEIIRQEIESVYASKTGAFKPNFTPYGRMSGWKTANLYSYFFKYPWVCRKFPKLHEIVRQIPGMCMTQIAVLEPHTRIRAHFGDTNAIVRSHLGIIVPGRLPELGIKVGSEEKGWEEGKVFSFCIVHRHCAWNFTDKPRIVLLVDTIRREYMDERYKIAGNTLALIGMKIFASKFPALKKIPLWLTKDIQYSIGLIFRLYLFLQRTLKW